MTVWDIMLWPVLIGMGLLIFVRPVVGRVLLALAGLASRKAWDE